MDLSITARSQHFELSETRLSLLLISVFFGLEPIDKEFPERAKSDERAVMRSSATVIWTMLKF